MLNRERKVKSQIFWKAATSNFKQKKHRNPSKGQGLNFAHGEVTFTRQLSILGVILEVSTSVAYYGMMDLLMRSSW